MRDFEPELAVVTGAGSGIGRATAKELARCGARVVVADINLETAEQTVAAIEATGGAAVAYRLDVADVAALETFASDVKERYGVPDVVVNNAGIFVGGPFLEIPQADLKRIIDISLLGMIHGCRLFGQQMAERGRGGHLVNVSSLAAYSPARFTMGYTVSKYAIKQFSECLSAELAPHDIGVTVVCPGLFATNLVSGAALSSVTEDQARLGRSGGVKLQLLLGRSPETAGRAIVTAVRRGQVVKPIGFESWLTYRTSRAFPRLTRAVIGTAMGPAPEWILRHAIAWPPLLDAAGKVVNLLPTTAKGNPPTEIVGA